MFEERKLINASSSCIYVFVIRQTEENYNVNIVEHCYYSRYPRWNQTCSTLLYGHV